MTLGLRRLLSLSRILKRRRTEKGALVLASSEVRFTVDSETADPVDVQEKVARETNSMVEEFMLAANISAAQKGSYSYDVRKSLAFSCHRGTFVHCVCYPRNLPKTAQGLNSILFKFAQNIQENLHDTQI